jgi:hypothetical protein
MRKSRRVRHGPVALRRHAGVGPSREARPVTFDRLDRVSASEPLRGLDDLARPGSHPFPAHIPEVAGAARASSRL